MEVFQKYSQNTTRIAIPCYGPVTIELSASSPLTRIRVGIDAAEPLIVTRTSFIVNSLSKYLLTYYNDGLICFNKVLLVQAMK